MMPESRPDLSPRVVEAAAAVAHETRRRLMELMGRPLELLPAWDQAPEPVRVLQIVRAQVLARGGTPAELHEDWCDQVRADGRAGVDVPGAALVRWDELPPEVRAVDEAEAAVVLDVCMALRDVLA